jgi:DNA-binding MarR family transcriptional regulator
MPSSAKTQKISGKRAERGPPYIGALLRMAYQHARERQLDAQAKRGFSDLNQALLSVLVYPPPDGERPSDLAERTNMTKQAMNYLLGQLEELGYVERRANKGRRRLVYLTKKGWTVFETQWKAMQDLEAEWSSRVGAKRFAEFLDVLYELSDTARR